VERIPARGVPSRDCLEGHFNSKEPLINSILRQGMTLQAAENSIRAAISVRARLVGQGFSPDCRKCRKFNAGFSS
jgi:hypothetical protein